MANKMQSVHPRAELAQVTQVRWEKLSFQRALAFGKHRGDTALLALGVNPRDERSVEDATQPAESLMDALIAPSCDIESSTTCRP